MRNSAILVEEALFEHRLNTLISLTESDLKELDKNLTEDELSALTESFKEDPELLVEFLGTIAGLGGRAAKYLQGKAKAFGQAVGGVGDKLSRYSDKQAGLASAKKMAKDRQSQIKQTRLAHRKAVVGYGKSLKGKDMGARQKAMDAMVAARTASKAARGVTGGKGPRTNMTPALSAKDRVYKRLGESLAEVYLEALNEGSLGAKRARRLVKASEKEVRRTRNPVNPKSRQLRQRYYSVLRKWQAEEADDRAKAPKRSNLPHKLPESVGEVSESTTGQKKIARIERAGHKAAAKFKKKLVGDFDNLEYDYPIKPGSMELRQRATGLFALAAKKKRRGTITRSSNSQKQEDFENSMKTNKMKRIKKVKAGRGNTKNPTATEKWAKKLDL